MARNWRWHLKYSILMASVFLVVTSGDFRTVHADATLDEIADGYETAHREAQFIHLEGTSTTEDGDRLEYTYTGTRDSFRTICFNGDELYGAFSLHDGRVQEFVPEHPKRLVLTYDAESDTCIPFLVNGRELDCLYGHTFSMWIGENATEWSWPMIGRRIREGQLHEQAFVGDHLCHVVEWNSQASYETSTRSTTFIYYIDTETFALRRMERSLHLIRDGEVVVDENWSLVYHTMELSAEPQDVEWDIWPIISELALDDVNDAEGASQEAALETFRRWFPR